MERIVEGFVDSEGVRIHYIAAKSNPAKKLSILFVPGVMMPAWIWERQIAYFSKDYRVAAIEPRSQGDSDKVMEGHNAFMMAKDIQAVVETLNLEPFILVGWSIGVSQVLNYAAHFATEKLKGLVLVDGIAGIDPTVSFYPSIVEFWSQFQMDRTANTKKFIKMIFKKTYTEEYYEKLTEVALRTPTDTVMTLLYNYILQDFRSLLPKIQTPTYMAVIDGPRTEYMKQIQKSFPNCNLEVFQSGHAIFVDEPERFNHSLEAFITKLEEAN